MGLKDLFNKREEQTTPEQEERSYTLGAQKIFRLSEDSLDLVVTGKLTGTLRVGDIVTVTNVGDDDGLAKTAAVYAIEDAERNRVFEATDATVIVWLEDALPLGLKKASVLHAEEASKEEIYRSYVTTIGDVFVGEQDGVLTDIDKEVMSLADIAEIWRIFMWYCNLNAQDETEEQHQANVAKIEQLVLTVRDKMLQATELVTVYSAVTGEPYLFSQTMQKEDGTYHCSAPMIFVAPVAYEERLTSRFSDEAQYKVKRISKGEDGEGIRQFFIDTFYLNGATGVHLIAEQTSIAAEGIVAPLDHEGMSEEEIPVTNPDVMRWILQMGQMGMPQTEEETIVYQLYYRFMALEMPKARFLTPVKVAAVGEQAQLLLNQDTAMKIALLPGKDEKEAVVFYTDWKRLRQIYDESWSGLIQNLSQVTKAFDVAVNPTGNPATGCYITNEVFEEMQKLQ